MLACASGWAVNRRPKNATKSTARLRRGFNGFCLSKDWVIVSGTKAQSPTSPQAGSGGFNQLAATRLAGEFRVYETSDPA
jgi:hypothetical protein